MNNNKKTGLTAKDNGTVLCLDIYRSSRYAKQGDKMPRAAREISESGRYHIMLRGIHKQNIFENDEGKEKYMSILTEYKETCGFEIYGFCLMSNHIHLLIKTGAEPLESIFKKNRQQICIIERILKEGRNKE